LYMLYCFAPRGAAPAGIHTLSLHDALPISAGLARAAKLFASLAKLDPSVEPWRALVDGAFANVEELAQAARDYGAGIEGDPGRLDRKSTRLNSSHRTISYAVFCLKKKKDNH